MKKLLAYFIALMPTAYMLYAFSTTYGPMEIKEVESNVSGYPYIVAFPSGTVTYDATGSTATISVATVGQINSTYTAISLLPSNTNYVTVLGSTQTKIGGLNIGGNIGIGTTNPAYQLELVQYNGSRLRLYDSLSGDNIALRSDGSALDVEANGDDLFIQANTNRNIFMNATSAGNIGIGTTGPRQKLEVAGSQVITGSLGIGTASPSSKLDVLDGSVTVRGTNAGLHLAGGGIQFPDDSYQTTAAGSSQWATAGTEIYNVNVGNVNVSTTTGARFMVGPGTFTALQGGNVGIGSSAPTSRLEVVNGSITVRGDNAGLRVEGKIQTNITGVGFFGAPISQVSLSTNVNSVGRLTVQNNNSGSAATSEAVFFNSDGDSLSLHEYSRSYSSAFPFNYAGGALMQTTSTMAYRSAFNGHNFFVGTYNAFKIHEGGNVGIGTQVPLATLHVASGTVLATNTGNVGIGTINPSQKLDVVGFVKTSGGIIFPDNSAQLTAASTSPWAYSGADIYNVNSGNIGVGNSNTNPQSLFEIEGTFLSTANPSFHAIGRYSQFSSYSSTSSVSISTMIPNLYTITDFGQNYSIGYGMLVTSGPVYATELCHYTDGTIFTGGTRNVSLFAGNGDFKGTVLLTTNSQTANNWRCAPLPAPVQLNEKTTYYPMSLVGGTTNYVGGVSLRQTNDHFQFTSAVSVLASSPIFTLSNDRGNDNYFGGAFKFITSTPVIAIVDGRVGIGTASPLGVLHVRGTAGAGAWSYFTGNANGSSPSSSITTGLGTAWNKSGGGGETTLSYGTGAGSAPGLSFAEWDGVTSTTNMHIKAGGNVGIGTTNPIQKLDVTGGNMETNRYLQIRAWDDDSANYGTGFGRIWYRGTGGASPHMPESFIVNTGHNFMVRTGKVGIGTTYPSAQLEVVDSSGITSSALFINGPSGDAGNIRFRDTNSSPQDFNIDYAAGNLRFFTETDFGTGGSVKMVVSNGGNVGIGTIAPLKRLHVYDSAGTNNDPVTFGEGVTYSAGASTFSANSNIQLNLGGVFNNGYNVIAGTTPSAKLYIHNYSNDETASGMFPIYVEDENSVNNPDFFLRSGSNGTNSNAKMFFVGDVGIGTQEPITKMDIRGVASSTVGIVFGDYNYPTASRYIGIANPNGSIITDSGFSGIEFGAPVNGPGEGYVAFHTHDFGVSSGEKMRITKGGNVGIGTTNIGSRLTIKDSSNQLRITDGTKEYILETVSNNFRIVENGAGVIPLTINPGGNVGIGTTSAARPLRVFGDARVGTGTTGCVEDADGTVIAGTCSSDERFKNFVSSMTPILSTFTKLEPEYYYWKFAEYPEQSWGNNMQLGLVAQQVEQHIPDLVFTDENGYKKVKYEQLPMYLLRAIKDLYDEVLELKQRVAILEGGGGQ